MKKICLSAFLILIISLMFTIDAEAANKLTIDIDNNNYSVNLLLDKDSKKNIDEDSLSEIEKFYNVEIKEKKSSYSITKDYEDFVQIDPKSFSEEWVNISRTLLKNEDIIVNFDEDLVSFLYSGVRQFKLEAKGLKNNLEIEINNKNSHIALKKAKEDEGENSEIGNMNNLLFNLENDNILIIQMVDYNYIKSAKVSTELTDTKINSTFEIEYNDNVPDSILSAIGESLQLEEFSLENKTVKFKITYKNSDYFSALHYRDLYNYLGIVGYLEAKDKGVYSKEKDLRVQILDVGGMNDIVYEFVNKEGSVKITKGEVLDKDGKSVSVKLLNDSEFEFLSKKTNSYAIIVTIIVSIMFSVLFIFAYLIFKKSR